MMIVIALFISCCDGVLRIGKTQGGGFVVEGDVVTFGNAVTLGEVVTFGDMVVSGVVDGGRVVTVEKISNESS